MINNAKYCANNRWRVAAKKQKERPVKLSDKYVEELKMFFGYHLLLLLKTTAKECTTEVLRRSMHTIDFELLINSRSTYKHDETCC